VDAAGNRYILKDIVLIGAFMGRPAFILASPHVRRYAREFFDCESMLGMYLENEGGLGSAGSH